MTEQERVLNPAAVDFDFDTLRLLVNAKRRKLAKGRADDQGFGTLSTILGLNGPSMRDFCHGRQSVLTVKTTVRLLVWLGHSDLADFIKEE